MDNILGYFKSRMSVSFDVVLSLSHNKTSWPILYVSLQAGTDSSNKGEVQIREFNTNFTNLAL